MADRIIVESYEGRMKRKLILWFVPILFIIVSFVDIKEFWPMLLLGVLSLGLLIYFKFLRKK